MKKQKIAIVLASIVYLIFGSFTIINMSLNYGGEEVYQYEGYLFAKGILTSYKDVFTYYPPLAYYIPGIFQRFLGPSFLVGRLVAFIFGFLAILMVIKICNYLQDYTAAAIAVWLIVTNPLLIQHYSSGIPHSIVIFFMLLSTLFAVNKNLNLSKIFFPIFFMTACVFSKQHTLQSLFFLIVYLLIIIKGRQKIWVIFSLILCLSIALLPFYNKLDNFFIHIFGLIFKVFLNKFVGDIDTPFWNISWSPFKQIILIETYLRMFFWFFVLLTSVITYIILNKKFRLTLLLQKEKLVFIGGLFFINFFVFLIMGGVFTIGCTVGYAAYYYPLGAVFVGILISKIINNFNNYNAKLFVMIAVFAGVIITPLEVGLKNIQLPLSYNVNKDINNAAEVLKKVTTSKDKIFVWGFPHLNFAADRHIYPELIATTLCFTNSKDKNLINKLKFYNIDTINFWVNKDADIIIFMPEYAAELNKSLGNNKSLHEINQVIKSAIKNYFQLVATTSLRGVGKIEIYKRKD